MRVLCYTDDFYLAAPDGSMDLGGSGHYRLELPYGALRERGYVDSVGYARRLVSRPSGELVGTDGQEIFDGADLVVLQRWMFPGSADRIRRAQACGQRVVIDCDDDYWSTPKRHVIHPLIDHLKRHMTETLPVADAVTCSTVALARRVARLADRDVFVLRNATDLREWAPAVDVSRLGLGWTGSLEYRDDDFRRSAPAIRRFLLANPDVTFTWIGYTAEGRQVSDVLRVPHDRIICHARQPLSDLRATLAESAITVGIVPLASGPFNEAKSWLKALEFASLGIPSIADRTGEYERWGAARLATSRRDWRTALDEVLDPVIRKDRARESADRAAAEDIAVKHVDWLDMIRSVR